MSPVPAGSAVGNAEDNVDRPGEVAVQRLVAKARGDQPVRIRQERIVGRQVLPQEQAYVAQAYVGAVPTVPTRQRDLEVELPEPVLEPDARQGDPRRQRAQGGVVERHESGCDRGNRGVHRPPLDLVRDVPGQLDEQVTRVRVGHLEHAVHQGAEGRARRQVAHG